MEARYDNSGSGTDDGEDNTPKENINAVVRNTAKDNRVQRNTLERKRKEKIKMYISQLREMIPGDFIPSVRRSASNNAVLEQAVGYMRHLKHQANLFFINNGNDAQRTEIDRLKQELMTVTVERDKYEKMVQQSAAVTPRMLAKISGKMTVDSPQDGKPAVSESPTEPPISGGIGTSQIPGQGLIITRSGQAYYVNEQGIPIAQGMAPAQLLSDNMMSKSVVTSTVQPTASSSASQSSLASEATVSTQSTNGVMQSSSMVASSSNIPNGLVALPGHSGHIPSAIILPNGQVIPVVTSNATLNPNVSAAPSSTGGQKPEVLNEISTCTSSSVVSSTANSTDITCATSNGIMLLGAQQAMGGTAANPGSFVQQIDVSSNQFGRKIMPKPTMFTQLPHAMMAPAITLAPIPLPTCSISIAPPLNSDIDTGKKKKTKKKKAKETEVLSNKDILATATASLFSPEKGKDSHETAGALPHQMAVVQSTGALPQQTPPSPLDQTSTAFTQQSSADQTTSNQIVPPHGQQLTTIPANALNGTRARRTRKRKNKQAKLASSGMLDVNQKPSKKPKPAKADPLPTVSDEKTISNDRGKLEASEKSETQAIEFDPNDLDNILYQVENIEGETADLPSDLIKDNERESKTESYQLVSGDEEIGHVFTTSDKLKTQTSESSNSPEAASYTASESYLIGNLTKTTEQPVDHRQKAQQMVTPSSSIAVQDAYSNSSTSYPPYYSEQPPPFSKTSQPLGEASVYTGPAQESQPQKIQASPSPPLPSRPKRLDSEHDNEKNHLEQYNSQSAAYAKPLDHSKEPDYPRSTANTANTLNPSSNSFNQTNSDQRIRVATVTQGQHPPAVSRPQAQSTVSVEPLVTTSTASTAWSPAKDAEWMSKSSSQSQLSYVNQNPPLQPYYRSQQSNEYPVSSSAESSHRDATKSLHPVQPFHDSPYQYTQFSAFGNNRNNTGTVLSNSASHNQNRGPEISYPNNSQNPTMFQPFMNSNTGYPQHQQNNQQNVWQTPNNDKQSSIHEQNQQSTDQDVISPPHHSSHQSTSHQNPAKTSAESAKQSSKPKYHSRQHGESRNAQKVHQRNRSTDNNQLMQSKDHVYKNPSGTLSTANTPAPYKQAIPQPPRQRENPVSSATPSKINMFSTENLLNKRDSVNSSQSAISQHPHPHYPLAAPLAAHPDTSRLIFNKDKDFLANQSNSTPFNVNLFNPSSQPLNALQAPASSSFGFSSFNDSSFTFSLTSTSECPPISSSASYSSKSSTPLPFFLPPSQQIGDLNASRSELSSSMRSNSDTGSQLTAMHNPYSNSFDASPTNAYQNKPDSRNISNGPQQPPPLIKSKRAKSRQPELPKDFPSLPYNFTTQSYGMPSFPASINSEATAHNIFTPQAMYNKPAGSLGIPFQHPGFAPLPTRSSHDFAPHPSPINQAPRFNINSFFKEKPIEAFKLSSNASHGSMYSQQPAHLYHNPMSINNILGSAPGFDTNRHPPSVAAFTSGHPGFPGFHHPFDFNVPNQP